MTHSTGEHIDAFAADPSATALRNEVSGFPEQRAWYPVGSTAVVLTGRLPEAQAGVVYPGDGIGHAVAEAAAVQVGENDK